jgi:hypothetical protein
MHKFVKFGPQIHKFFTLNVIFPRTGQEFRDKIGANR